MPILAEATRYQMKLLLQVEVEVEVEVEWAEVHREAVAPFASAWSR